MWRPLVPLVFALGGVFLAAHRRRWRTHWLPVALCMVGVLPPIGFSAGVPGHMMYQARYGYLVAPFASAIVAWTVCGALAALKEAACRAPLATGAGTQVPPEGQFVVEETARNTLHQREA